MNTCRACALRATLSLAPGMASAKGANCFLGREADKERRHGPNLLVQRKGCLNMVVQPRHVLYLLPGPACADPPDGSCRQAVPLLLVPHHEPDQAVIGALVVQPNRAHRCVDAIELLRCRGLQAPPRHRRDSRTIANSAAPSRDHERRRGLRTGRRRLPVHSTIQSYPDLLLPPGAKPLQIQREWFGAFSPRGRLADK